MSRPNVAKSRADKAGKAASAPTPAQIHEIIPGKFTDQDWNVMVDHDENDDFITDIIEELCSSALDIIYKSYIERQLIPFTVCQAKDAILQIIEWRFLTLDKGEDNVEQDMGWMEDEEPVPAITDCWAQGSVPRTLYTPREPVIEEDVELEQIDDETEREMSQIVEETQEQIQNDSTRAPLGGIQHERTIIEDNPPLMLEGWKIEPKESAIQVPVKPKTPKKKKPFKRHFGPLKSAGLGKLTQSLKESEIDILHQTCGYQEVHITPSSSVLNMPNSCHSIIKLQAGRPPGHRDVVYDDLGNVIQLTKLHPEQLPNHKVKTKALIVDPDVEAAQSRLESMRTGRHLPTKPSNKDLKDPMTRSKARTSCTTFSVRTGVSVRTTKTDKSTVMDGPRSPLPPPLIDSMDVAPGVIVREGDRIKKGPRQRSKHEDLIIKSALSRGLRSIRLKPDQGRISVRQILESHTLVKPMIDQNPIPPINASPPVQ